MKKTMKRAAALTLTAAMVASMTACGGGAAEATKAAETA